MNDTRAQDFARLVSHHAIKSGYDLSGKRSGGRTALAADTGMSPSSVGRMLDGQTIPHAWSLEALGKAIGLPVAALLEAAGVVSPGKLTTGSCGWDGPYTVERAAADLGIRTRTGVALLDAITKTLLAQEQIADVTA